MDEECSKTPYNSIYKTLNGQSGILLNKCCKHGELCQYGREKPKETPKSEQYVNLATAGEELMLREQLKKMQLEQQKAPEPVKRSEKKKKMKPIEENHPYEFLGPPTEVSTASSVGVPTITSTTSTVCFKGDANTSYIGVSSAAHAETLVSRRGEFQLYHLYEPRGGLDNLSAGLPLMLVYYTTTKKHRHYPIRFSANGEHLQYWVDSGYPIVRNHYSLDQLVLYYKNSIVSAGSADFHADSFHWWLE